MNRLVFNRKLLFILPLLIILSSFIIAKSAMFLDHASELSIGVTLDLILLLPLFYFLAIRKTKIPKTTVVPVFIIGVVIGTYILPENGQFLLSNVKTWVIPIVEISVVTVVVLKVRKVIRMFRAQNDTDFDFYSILKTVTSEMMLKRLSVAVSTEIALFYYGFINWKSPKLSQNQFTNHKNSSGRSLLYAVIFLILVESVALHLLLDQWSTIAAWILTGLTVYSGVQIFGFARSLNKRPITVDLEEGLIKLKFGILAETEVAISNIKNIEESTNEIEKDSEVKMLSPLGQMDNHNLIIHLNEPHILHGIYGIKKEYTSIAVNVDNKDRFLEILDI
jgi:hypothetical protein